MGQLLLFKTFRYLSSGVGGVAPSTSLLWHYLQQQLGFIAQPIMQARHQYCCIAFNVHGVANLRLQSRCMPTVQGSKPCKKFEGYDGHKPSTFHCSMITVAAARFKTRW